MDLQPNSNLTKLWPLWANITVCLAPLLLNAAFKTSTLIRQMHPSAKSLNSYHRSDHSSLLACLDGLTDVLEQFGAIDGEVVIGWSCKMGATGRRLDSVYW